MYFSTLGSMRVRARRTQFLHKSMASVRKEAKMVGSNGTARGERTAQQRGGMHRGRRNTLESTRLHVWRGHSLGSDEHMDTTKVRSARPLVVGHAGR